MGVVACVLGACAGLKVSAQRLIRISILVQLLIGGESAVVLVASVAMGSASQLPGLTLFRAAASSVAAVLQIACVGLIVVAAVRRKEYPWAILKWVFAAGTAAFCAPFFVDLAGTYLAGGGPLVLVPSAWLLPLVFFLPPVLQVVLLWWRRKPASPELGPLVSADTSAKAGSGEGTP